MNSIIVFSIDEIYEMQVLEKLFFCYYKKLYFLETLFFFFEFVTFGK